MKNYTEDSDQGVEYRRFLAKCYRVEVVRPRMFDHYMWITWAPFLVTRWPKLSSPNFISEALNYDHFCRDVALAGSTCDNEIVDAVAEKLIVVVLSERQEERLMLQGDELLHVQKSLLEVRDN